MTATWAPSLSPTIAFPTHRPTSPLPSLPPSLPPTKLTSPTAAPSLSPSPTSLPTALPTMSDLLEPLGDRCDGVLCSGHGQCVEDASSIGKCVCDRGWIGQECEHVPLVLSLLSNVTACGKVSPTLDCTNTCLRSFPPASQPASPPSCRPAPAHLSTCPRKPAHPPDCSPARTATCLPVDHLSACPSTRTPTRMDVHAANDTSMNAHACT